MSLELSFEADFIPSAEVKLIAPEQLQLLSAVGRHACWFVDDHLWSYN